MTQVRDTDKSMKAGCFKAAHSIRLRARVFFPGRRHRIEHVTMAMSKLMNAMQRTAQGNPIFGCNWRNMIGNMTLPTLDPIDAQPMAMGLFVVNDEEITTMAGMYETPPPNPTQKACPRSI
jgi:hypothetical protein